MRSSQTILVVDDVPYLLDLAAVFLSRTARVVTARGGEAGLAAAWREQPDLVLCDLHMPGMDGASLCRRLRQDPDLRDVPFIAMVAGDSGADRGRALRAGADDVLAKPISRLALVDMVSRFLAHARAPGLPRVDTALPVTLTRGGSEMPGVVRNLSRGGLFIETECDLEAHDEVSLRFRLPDSSVVLAPCAEVVWCRRPDGDPGGAGMRFLEIDGPSVRSLDAWVFERVSSTGAQGAA